MTFVLPAIALAAAFHAQTTDLPRLISRDGRHALMVDGEPFAILGAQVHNFSNYPEALKHVWPAVLDQFQRPGNALPVPEIGDAPTDAQRCGSGGDATVCLTANNVRLG